MEHEDHQVGRRLRQMRESKAMRARDVADRAGVSPAYLSRLENGRVSPTVATLGRLVQAMGETIASLFEPTPGGDGTVVRSDQRQTMESRGVVDLRVTPAWATRLEILESVVAPGHGSSARLHTHGGEEECVLVLEGELDIWVGDQRHNLRQGDSATFHSRTPHRWRNPAQAESRVLWIITPATY
jgi:transcriptional regulator with XRE-family HTH domain